jgi:Animal haem peroxidase
MSAFQCVRGPAFAGLVALVLSSSTSLAVAQGTHASTHYPSVEAIGTDRGENVGGFGRLFELRAPAGTDGRRPSPDALLPHPSPRYDLLKLGDAVVSKSDTTQETEKSEMPVGYVFLGQFIDHDLTLDTVTGFDRLAGRSDLENARTPELDLDCVYGGGPERTPFLYDGGGPYLRVGAPLIRDAERYDLFRVSPPNDEPSDTGPTALIGDPRNDENFIVSQMQAAFVAYHNRIVDRLLEKKLAEFKDRINAIDPQDPQELYGMAQNDLEKNAVILAFDNTSVPADADPATKAEAIKASIGDLTREKYFEDIVKDSTAEKTELLEEAREIVIHHYHRMILEDFLPRIIGINRVLDILENGRDFYFRDGFADEDGNTPDPYIPIEFAVAAYRFGHSQVPGTLNIRKNAVAALFPFVAKESQEVSEGPEQQKMRFIARPGFTRMRAGSEDSAVIDWNYLVGFGGAGPVETALKIDTKLASPLGKLDKSNVVGAGGIGNLAQRNLSRGRTYRLPSGQDLACQILAKLDQRHVLERIYRLEDKPDEKETFACADKAGNRAAYSDYALAADQTTEQVLALRRTPLWYYILQEAGVFGGPFDKQPTLTRNGNSFLLALKAIPEEESTTPSGQPSANAQGNKSGKEATLEQLGRVVRTSAAPPPVASTSGESRSADKKTSANKQEVGATLGPVGATIVGETLIGLIDHYREKSGKGLDLNSPLRPKVPNDATEAGTEPSNLTQRDLTETKVTINGKPLGYRYLLSNFLYDAGVAGAINESNVCVGDASQPTDPC